MYRPTTSPSLVRRRAVMNIRSLEAFDGTTFRVSFDARGSSSLRGSSELLGRADLVARERLVVRKVVLSSRDFGYFWPISLNICAARP